LSGILIGKKLSGSTTLPTTTIGLVGARQMVFTKLIMITYVNRMANRPLVNSMVVGGYRSVDVTNPRKGYQ
jgi:hypothetical protein